MHIVTEGEPGVSVLSVPSEVLACGIGFALILLVTWVGLLYFKVLRLSGKDQDHGLNVLKELTDLIKAAFGSAKSESNPDE
jgi:hypothetical protein